jgi:hypothetical protein
MEHALLRQHEREQLSDDCDRRAIIMFPVSFHDLFASESNLHERQLESALSMCSALNSPESKAAFSDIGSTGEIAHRVGRDFIFWMRHMHTPSAQCGEQLSQSNGESRSGFLLQPKAPISCHDNGFTLIVDADQCGQA